MMSPPFRSMITQGSWVFLSIQMRSILKRSPRASNSGISPGAVARSSDSVVDSFFVVSSAASSCSYVSRIRMFVVSPSAPSSRSERPHGPPAGQGIDPLAAAL